MFNSKNKGFSLVELIIVLIITGILAQIGFVAFNRYTRKTRAFAAKTAINNIKKECQSNKALNVGEIFTITNINGYKLNPENTNNCYGEASTGKVSAVPHNIDEGPSFFYEHLTGLITEVNNTSRQNNNIFDGNKKYSGFGTGLETKERGFYSLEINPVNLKQGERMAVLEPGGEYDIQIYLEGVNSKGDYKVCLSAGEYKGRWVQNSCNEVSNPAGKSSEIGISYSRGGYGIYQPGSSIRGSHFTGDKGSRLNMKTTVGEFTKNTKNKILENLTPYSNDYSSEKPIKAFNGEIKSIRHFDQRTLDYNKPPWNKLGIPSNYKNFYEYSIENKDSSIGITYTGKDWENKKDLK